MLQPWESAGNMSVFIFVYSFKSSMVPRTKEARKRNCRIKLKQTLNLLERQENMLGTA